MSDIFDRVKFNVSGAPGTGTVTVGTRSAGGFFLPTEQGAVDGDKPFYILTKANGDEETGRGLVSDGATKVQRVRVLSSISGGAAGTSKIDLDGPAVMAFVTPAEAMRTLRSRRTVTASSASIDNKDGGGLIVFNRATAIAVSIDEAGASGEFLENWFVYLKNINDGDVTVTPDTSTIEEQATFVLKRNQAALIISDETNYSVLVFRDDFGSIATKNVDDYPRFDAQQSKSAAEQAQLRANYSLPLRGHLFGLTLSNNGIDATNDIDIAVGEAASEQSNPILMVLGTAMVKRLDANWAPGTNEGMRNSAAAITNATYHIYLVSKANGADVDIYAHTSAAVATVLTALQAEAGGSAYVNARRIGSIIRESAAIRPFVQYGDKFRPVTPIPNVQVINPGTSAVTVTLLGAPIGIEVDVEIHGSVRNDDSGTAAYSLLSALSDANLTPSASLTDWPGPALFGGAVQISSLTKTVRVNTSGQVRFRSAFSSAAVFINFRVISWTDKRGRMA